MQQLVVVVVVVLFCIAHSTIAIAVTNKRDRAETSATAIEHPGGLENLCFLLSLIFRIYKPYILKLMADKRQGCDKCLTRAESSKYRAVVNLTRSESSQVQNCGKNVAIKSPTG